MAENVYPKRKSPRLQEYDYTTPNYYFITICTQQKKKLFGEIGNINRFGQIATEAFLQIPSHFSNVTVDKFVVMPNHVHAIIVLKESQVNLSTVIGLYKSFVTKKIHEHMPDFRVWQASFHDHVIRNQKSYEKIWTYIDTNPIKWSEDCFYEE